VTATVASVALRIAAVAGESARIEARWLIEEAAGDAVRLEAMVARRLAGEPVDRVIGRRGFWTLDIKVTPDVLSPRSDTETIVRAVLQDVEQRQATLKPLRILDLGTGSGAILLALLAALPMADGLGIDISEAALAVARENAERNGLSARASFRLGHWASNLEGQFDIIVSNPPYIPAADIAGLEPEVRDFDPHVALDGGEDGLEPYRIILSQITPLLAPEGLVAFEFGQGQGPDVGAIARSNGFDVFCFSDDLNGIQRIVNLIQSRSNEF
jgi:release factor glutamine methyltransferase